MKKKAFTLIEIMIVLLIFSVGVLAVLRMIIYNMKTMDELNARTTATLLAKEGLELAYNTRDSNRIAELPWDCIAKQTYTPNNADPNSLDVCQNYFLDNSGKWTLRASGNKILWNTIANNNLLTGAKLYINTGASRGYTHRIADQKSIFSRYISFSKVKTNSSTINTGYLLKIESHVHYQKGSKKSEIFLEGFIGNY